MTVRLLAIPLEFHFLVTCFAITTPLKEDLFPKIITLNATRLEYEKSESIELNCSSSRKSIGNGAEFIVNGLTVEHISFRDNKCYNRKMEECITDHCQCFPSDMLYIYEHTDTLLATELIVGCRMRFADNKTYNIIKAFISLRFNGTASALHRYDVKMIKQDTDKNTNENENNNFMGQIFPWLAAICGVLLVISAAWILFICCVRRHHRNWNTYLPEAIHILSTEEKDRYKMLMQTEKTEKRYCVRVLIVGKESTGKTCVLRRLLNEDISDVTSTDGVDIVVSRCKINIEDGKWVIGKEINDDKVSRIKRALKDTQHMQNDETTNKNKVLHSETSFYKRDTTTDILVSLDKSENTNASSSLLKHEDATTDVQIHLNTNKENMESSSLAMPLDLMDIVLSKSTDNTLSNLYALCELWDFAGQKEFYATHQAFLTSCAVYLLVADMKDDISKQGLSQWFAEFQDIGEYIDFWFESIHCHSTTDERFSYGHFDPPIILVFTGKDRYDNEADFKERERELKNQMDRVFGLQSRYYHLIETFYVSNTNDIDKVFENLRYSIFEAARNMDNWGKDYPLKWILLEHLIEINKNNGQNFINFNEMFKLAKHHDINIVEKADLVLFLRFQHNVGHIIFFENIPDLIILRPQWLADAFRCLVSDRVGNRRLHHLEDWTLFRRQGKISESLIIELLKSKDGSQFSGQERNLQKVMEKLDILIKIENSSFYIMPSMMPSSTFDIVCEQFGILTENCKRTSWLCLKFEFLPPSFFNHLSAWFIRNYYPSKIDSGIALYRGICMFDIDRSGGTKILVTMSTDTIALQVLSFIETKEKLGNKCNDLYIELIHLLEDIKAWYQVKISFKLHFKCSDGYYYKDTFEYETLASNKECYCFQHKTGHQSEKIYLPWMTKEVKRNPDRVNISRPDDHDPNKNQTRSSIEDTDSDKTDTESSPDKTDKDKKASESDNDSLSYKSFKDEEE